MQLSDQGLELIKSSEGFRSHTYIDAAGFFTIGYGHKLRPGESYPDGIDEARATALLAADVQATEQAVCRLVKVALTQGQFDALVDFSYNLGAARLAASTLLRELNAGHYDQARAQLLRWDLAGGQELAALKSRRVAEFRLWTASANHPLAA
ncbi:MAG TPA: lysozyme [Terracidiphilus sp.]|nr:lysozyme [Terracidiphilus sp.]